MLGTIEVKNIKLYAYHGCMEEEAMIGSNYSVDVWVKGDFLKASETDELEDAVDYVLIHQIVAQEMAIRSKLLEHVARRIIHRIEFECKELNSIKVKVSKLCPPINGDVEHVSVILESIL